MNFVVYFVLIAVYAISLRLRKWIDRQQLKAAFENPRRARNVERLYAALAILNWIVIIVTIGFTIYII
mgnify:CR=1